MLFLPWPPVKEFTLLTVWLSFYNVQEWIFTLDLLYMCTRISYYMLPLSLPTLPHLYLLLFNELPMIHTKNFRLMGFWRLKWWCVRYVIVLMGTESILIYLFIYLLLSSNVSFTKINTIKHLLFCPCLFKSFRQFSVCIVTCV